MMGNLKIKRPDFISNLNLRLERVNIFIGACDLARQKVFEVFSPKDLIVYKVCTVEQYFAILQENQYSQLIFITDNPVLLDQLDINNPEQALFVIDYTITYDKIKIRRIKPPKPIDGCELAKLSTAFSRGYIGGLRKPFLDNCNENSNFLPL
jgi:hypothetical protein